MTRTRSAEPFEGERIMSPRKLLWLPGLFAVAALGACGGEGITPMDPSVGSPPTVLSSVTPVVVPGNPDCEDLGYDFGFKIDATPVNGTYYLVTGSQNGLSTVITSGVDDPLNSVTISNATATSFDWTSTLGMDAVIVKAGPNANHYAYDPESYGDTGLVGPTNPSNGQPYGTSHVEFCYDYEVDVSKTANAGYERAFDWEIEKTGDQTELTLSAGQSFAVNYQVVVDTTGYTDGGWYVEGVITIDNATPYTATITGVTDVISGPVPATVDCGVTFPYELAAGGTLECDYDADLPDATTRLNTATVTTSGFVGGGEGTADVVFGDPTVLVDECVDVTDDLYGALGQVCVADAPKTFNYSMNVGPYAICDEYEVTNTATYLATDDDNDTGETGSEGHTVLVSVVGCGGDFGCTLTPGYWKTHSDYGPAPYDDTWALLEDPDFFGPDTPFFLSGQTYYQVLWTQPRGGNAYYILARAWIAAYLNVLNGADIPAEVLAAWDAAKTGFETYTPAEVGAWKRNNGDRAAWIELAGILDEYNNGLTGPGHCSEDSSSAD
jgi:hypothetical protein